MIYVYNVVYKWDRLKHYILISCPFLFFSLGCIFVKEEEEKKKRTEQRTLNPYFSWFGKVLALKSLVGKKKKSIYIHIYNINGLMFCGVYFLIQI